MLAQNQLSMLKSGICDIVQGPISTWEENKVYWIIVKLEKIKIIYIVVWYLAWSSATVTLNFKDMRWYNILTQCGINPSRNRAEIELPYCEKDQMDKDPWWNFCKLMSQWIWLLPQDPPLKSNQIFICCLATFQKNQCLMIPWNNQTKNNKIHAFFQKPSYFQSFI